MAQQTWYRPVLDLSTSHPILGLCPIMSPAASFPLLSLYQHGFTFLLVSTSQTSKLHSD